MSRTRVRFNAFAILACSALLFASFGCSNPGTVMAPDSAPVVVTSPDFIHILSTSKGDPFAATARSVSNTVFAEFGGTVSNGRVTLEFPAGALDQDTEITIDMYRDGTLGVELGPHGIQFNKPVLMSMSLRGTSAEGLADQTSTLWWNEDLEQWERMDKAASGPNEESCYLEHFSKYKGNIGG